MKKILIIDKSFAVGGIQTSLINMVKALKDKYEIDVLMFHNKGTLKKHFPEDVNIITPKFLMRLHGMGLKESKSEGKFVYLMRCLTAVFDRIFSNRLSLRFAMFFEKKLKGYDAVIAFHHETSINATVSGFYRYAYRKTDAKIKLGWIHYDPEYISSNDMKNERYMKKMDKIICVSQGTANKFKTWHPSLAQKIDCCYNFQDIDRILRLSQETANLKFDKTKFNCFSACRLSDQKAIPRAIEAFAPVLKNNPDVVWYIAGDGKDRIRCEELIRENNLQEQIVLLGSIDNPYVYMVQSDLYIQPSIYEAAPMVYGEAMICKVPIFTTENISSEEMVKPEFGFICENSLVGMRKALASLLEDRKKITECKNNYNKFEYSNDVCCKKMEELLQGDSI